ncbi:HEAT repeat domain-containing protein [Pedosphaera parvula]|uniref:HEAT domain containing protein n=1 Tax=Pedosphaera parvula (strain Ellin514) TaxID=320771 RepID=B9XCM0_PEDPL|nr:HEAT repeat domain-containing protein [Pedosphaera parvula]EEF62688.1 HEAT domain containing protein [Pedosphaera parvula Ellin514]
MAWAKLKTAVIVGTAILLAAGTTTLVVDWIKHPELTYQGKSIGYWLDQLHSGNAQAQFQAHLSLLEIGEPAVPYLLRDFTTKDTSSRQLYRKWYPKMPSSLMKRLPPPVNIRRFRIDASGVLREMGPAADPAVPEYIKALKDPDRAIRETAGFALEFIMPDDEETIVALVEALKKEPDLEMVRMGLHSIIFERDKRTASAVPGLTEILENELQKGLLDYETVRKIITWLQHLEAKAQPAVPVLKEVVHAQNSTFRFAALEALVKIDKQSVSADEIVQILSRGLKDSNPSMRNQSLRECTWAQKEFPKGAETLKPLIEELTHDQNKGVDETAAMVLCNFPPVSDDVVASLKELLQSRDTNTRISVATALGKLNRHTEEAISTLTAMARETANTNMRTRISAAMALWKLNGNADEALALALPGLHDKDIYGTRQTAFVTLGELGPAATPAIPELTNLLNTGEGNDPLHAADALWKINHEVKATLPVVIKSLGDRFSWSKSTAVRLISEMGMEAKSAVPALQRMIEDSRTSITVHDQAIAALEKLDPEALARTMEKLEKKKQKEGRLR